MNNVMKFKHSFKNYLLAPLIILVNPCVYFITIVLEKLYKLFDNLLSILPKFDIDYSDDISRTKGKVIKEYFKLTQKEKHA